MAGRGSPDHHKIVGRRRTCESCGFLIRRDIRDTTVIGNCLLYEFSMREPHNFVCDDHIPSENFHATLREKFASERS